MSKDQIKPLVFQNFITENIDIIKTNLSYTAAPSAPQSNFNVSIKCSVRVNKYSLVRQADVFARQILESGQNPIKKMGFRDNNAKDNLMQIYIYSYFKAYFAGYFKHIDTNLVEDTMCFIGHTQFYNTLLRTHIRHDSHNTVDTTRTISISDEDHIHNTDVFLSFSFMKDVSISRYDQFRDYKCECLTQAYINFNNKDETWTSFTRLTEVGEFVASINNPLLNACYSEDFSEINYVPSPNVALTDPNYSWNTACFIYFIEINDDELSDVSDLFATVPVHFENNKFTKFEVHAITLMHPRLDANNNIGGDSYGSRGGNRRPDGGGKNNKGRRESGLNDDDDSQ